MDLKGAPANHSLTPRPNASLAHPDANCRPNSALWSSQPRTGDLRFEDGSSFWSFRGNQQGTPTHLKMGQTPNRAPSAHPNPPTKIGSNMGGAATPWDAIRFDRHRFFGRLQADRAPWPRPPLGWVSASSHLSRAHGPRPRSPKTGPTYMGRPQERPAGPIEIRFPLSGLPWFGGCQILGSKLLVKPNHQSKLAPKACLGKWPPAESRKQDQKFDLARARDASRRSEF